MSIETTMVTFAGKEFDITNLRPEQICIEDIAHSLALTNRYRGHTLFPYSVAEHCVTMSVLDIGDPLVCLLHDAAEAYIGDQSSPQKKMMRFFMDEKGLGAGDGESFKRTELRVLRCIGEALGIPNLDCRSLDPEIHRADGCMYLTEVRDLMPKNDVFGLWHPNSQPLQFISLSYPWSWVDAEIRYLERYRELTNGKS